MQEDDNNTAFWTIGGLVIIAIVAGYFYWSQYSANNPANIEPAAGIYSSGMTPDSNTTTSSTTTTTTAPATTSPATDTTMTPLPAPAPGNPPPANQ